MTAIEHDHGIMPAAKQPARRRRLAPDSGAAATFGALGGPVVAICGLTGGAGTTTLAYVLARTAARESVAPVLLAELPAASGGLSALAGVPATRSIGRLIASGADASIAPATGPDGLLVLASGPEASPELATEERRIAFADLLGELREQHGLVVLDCGTLHTPDAQAAVALATHVVWTVQAGRAGAGRARALLDGPLAPPPGTVHEVLAVASTRRVVLPVGSDRALRAVASERCERLVLIPHVPELASGRLGAGSRRLSTACAAIAGVLRRPSLVT